jgi:hypothetical protein
MSDLAFVCVVGLVCVVGIRGDLFRPRIHCQGK